jgi:hypothetical protein
LLSTTRPTRVAMCHRTKPLARQGRYGTTYRQRDNAPKACLGLTAPWTWRGLSSIQYAKLHSQELRLSPG